MKVLFLDIDGVVNSADWWKRRGPVPEHDSPRQMDPAAVMLVDEVVRRTGCEVVLSSTWRLMRGRAQTQRLLRANGATFRLYDSTPDCATKVHGLFLGHERGAEIDEWLRAHPGVERFAIVDDSADMGPHLDKLVRTDFGMGIQREHVEALVVMLGEGARS